MPDLPINSNNFKNPKEILDLRESNDIPLEKQDHGFEVPKTPEQIEIPAPKSIDNQKQSMIKEQGFQTMPGSIISVGQNRALSAQRAKDIENILSEGMEKLYLAMDAQNQMRFKAKGEEATRSINALIEQGKCSLKKLLEIIKNWLTLIPGVNKFFLEQEAKIKADKIMNIQRNYG